MPPALFLLPRIACYSRSLLVPHEYKGVFSSSVRNAIGILSVSVLNPFIYL